MERNKSIEQILESMDKSIIKKVTVFPLKTALLFILSFGIIGLDYILPTNLSNILTPILILITIALFLWGFLIGVVDITYYKHLKTGQKINIYEIFINRREHEKLLKIIASNNFDQISTLHISKNDGIKLKIAATEDKSLCFVQVLKYVPFQFARSNKAKELNLSQVNELFDSLDKLNPDIQKSKMSLV